MMLSICILKLIVQIYLLYVVIKLLCKHAFKHFRDKCQIWDRFIILRVFFINGEMYVNLHWSRMINNISECTVMRDTIGKRLRIVCLISLVGAGSSSLSFGGAPVTVFSIHSVVGGENNDCLHVHWLLSRFRSFCLWRSNTRQFSADMMKFVFSAKKRVHHCRWSENQKLLHGNIR